MNAARPAVQLCCPYQSVNIEPSRAMRSMVGRPVAHYAEVVGADVVPADVVTPDDEDVGLLFCGLGDRRRPQRDAADQDGSDPGDCSVHGLLSRTRTRASSPSSCWWRSSPVWSARCRAPG